MNSVILNKNQIYLLIVLFACFISRMASTIYYIEDIDSLRFALSLYDYSLENLQPHFPGYPVFCFFAKILYLIMPSMGISFSIIGAISTFEEAFGFLWGHGSSDDKLSEEEEIMKEVWEKTRTAILNNGNNQIRSAKNEIECNTVHWDRYNVQIPITEEENKKEN